VISRKSLIVVCRVDRRILSPEPSSSRSGSIDVAGRRDAGFAIEVVGSLLSHSP
jgi:hypothetical protein